MVQMDLLAQTRDQNAATRLQGAFLAVLADGNWHRCKDICARIPGLNERAARLIAEQSNGDIIGAAQGYKLTRCATVEELDHFERAQLSQARKTINRVRLTRIARNRGVAA